MNSVSALDQTIYGREEDSLKKRLIEDRIDLVKRLFAVIMSVGVATRLGRIIYDSNPTHHDVNIAAVLQIYWTELLLLLVSTIALVGSWQGYLLSIERTKQLQDDREAAIRFYLDIAIVFAYLVLTLSSQFFALWFWALAVIFVLYLAWDLAPLPFIKPDSPRFSGKHSIPSGIFITAVWLIFFIALAILVRTTLPIPLALSAGAALGGTIAYRIHKELRPPALKIIATAVGFLILAIVGRAIP